jgi:hypothetical protein
MRAKKPAVEGKKATIIVANDPDDLKRTLKRILQVMLDRGEELDWFGSGEIVTEAIILGILLVPRPYLHRAREANFCVGRPSVLGANTLEAKCTARLCPVNERPVPMEGRPRHADAVAVENCHRQRMPGLTLSWHNQRPISPLRFVSIA